MRIWHSLTFEHKTLAIFTGLFLLVSVNCLLIFFILDREDHDIKIITAWEKKKSEVEQVLYLLFKTETKQANLDRETGKSLTSFSELLTTTLQGGVLDKKDVMLSAADDESRLKLEKVKASWENLSAAVRTYIREPQQKDSVYQRIEQVPLNDTIFTTRVVSDIRKLANPVAVGARADIEEYFPAWSAAGNEFIDYLYQKHTGRRAEIINLTLIFWILVAVGLLILFLKSRQNIFIPLNNILVTGEKISRGYYNEQVKGEYKHELARISTIFNNTAETLKKATIFIQSLGEGKLQDTLELQGEHADNDSLAGSLVKMQKQMQQLEQEEQERKWISEGLTKFADLLRTNNDSLEKLTDKLTAALVKYTGSIVGGTYLLNDEEPQELQLSACYALNTKKYLTRKYKPGEGLVGQTFLEEDYIYLLEIPDNYISIASGIGEASPKAILLVPLKMEQTVFGVVELASLREYKEHEIAFVRKLSESIAATIQSVKINERTKMLLEESQEMTDLMRSQEEEMRQNMEELSATQEEMARKEQETIARLEVINRTIILAEYDMSRKISYVSKNFALLYKYRQDEMIGMNIQKITPDNDAGREQVNKLWMGLSEGKVVSGQYSRIDRTGKELLIETTFTPVFNGTGKIIKVVEISKEVSNSAPGTESSELDKMLKQHLDALDITEKVFSQKAKKYEGLEDMFVSVEVDCKGIIKSIEESKKAFGTAINSVLELEGISEEIFRKERSEGAFKINNSLKRYIMKKINNDSYLFLIVNI